MVSKQNEKLCNEQIRPTENGVLFELADFHKRPTHKSLNGEAPRSFGGRGGACRYKHRSRLFNLNCNWHWCRSSIDWLRFGQAAVLANAPEVDGDENRENGRQHNHMQNIETQQSFLANRRIAQQQETKRLADEGRVAGDGRADRDGPESQLIPWQQVAGKA